MSPLYASLPITAVVAVPLLVVRGIIPFTIIISIIIMFIQMLNHLVFISSS